jgi:hypothetical protein
VRTLKHFSQRNKEIATSTVLLPGSSQPLVDGSSIQWYKALATANVDLSIQRPSATKTEVRFTAKNSPIDAMFVSLIIENTHFTVGHDNYFCKHIYPHLPDGCKFFF